jgi:hypothetical protein
MAGMKIQNRHGKLFAHAQLQRRPQPPLTSNIDRDEIPSLPQLPASGEGADVDSSSPLPAWRISPMTTGDTNTQ